MKHKNKERTGINQVSHIQKSHFFIHVPLYAIWSQRVKNHHYLKKKIQMINKPIIIKSTFIKTSNTCTY